MSLKTCNICNLSLPTTDFTRGKKSCKTCRNSKANQSYNSITRKEKYNKKKDEEWLRERTPLRNELLRQCMAEGLTIEEFNKLFIKREDFDEIVDNPDYEFAYSDKFKTDFIPKEDFEKGYVLDCVMCGKYGERKITQIFFII